VIILATIAALAMPPGLFERTGAAAVGQWSRELWWIGADRIVVLRQEKRRLDDQLATGCEARAWGALSWSADGLLVTTSVVARGGVVLLDADVSTSCEAEIPAGEWAVEVRGRGWTLVGPTRVELVPVDDIDPDWSER
jgi:hypothetical protein